MVYKNIKSKVQNKKLSLSEVISVENLQAGYAILRSGSAPGIDKVTKAEFKENQIQELHKSLRNHTYKPSPSKRVNIPKSNGGTRYLAINTTRDKVVQAALYLKLRDLVEPSFSADSYGFRPKLGCHDALNQLKYTWQACRWVFKFDIHKCFDTINHELLIKFLEEFCEQSVLELVRKMLKAKIIYIGNLNDNLDSDSIGVPQGSILSPLLCNIYFDKFDKWILEIKIEWNRGVSGQYNPDYNKVPFSEAELQVIKDLPEVKNYLFKAKLNKKILEGKNPRRDPKDPNFTRLYYIRYANDFIVGFVGTREQAVEVQSKIYDYLESELKFELSKEKSKIYHGSDKGIFFLGVYVRWSLVRKLTKSKDKETDNSKKISATAINNAIFRAPVKKLLQRAVDREFGKIRKSNGLPRPTSFRRWTGFEDKMIVNRFSSIIRGLYNYYTCVNSRSDLWPVLSFYRKACALTLADKHKLKTSAKVFKKYGPRLTIRDKLNKVVCQLFYPETLKTNVTFKRAQVDRSLKVIDNFMTGVAGGYNINSPSSEQCQYPGCHTKFGLEEHHINPQANIKASTSFLKKLKAKNRKTVTLCRKHHLLVHKKVQGKNLNHYVIYKGRATCGVMCSLHAWF